MKRRHILIFTSLLPGPVAAPCAAEAPKAAKPNVIVIMADDLGYETVGANGGAS